MSYEVRRDLGKNLDHPAKCTFSSKTDFPQFEDLYAHTLLPNSQTTSGTANPKPDSESLNTTRAFK